MTKYIISAFILLLPLSMLAQDPVSDERLDRIMEKLEERKISFITRKVNFSVEEAQQFWPLYNEITAEQKRLRKEQRQLRHYMHKNAKSMTDQELEDKLDKFIQIQGDEADLQANYHKRFKKVLPVRKLVMYYRTEEMFRKRVLQELKDKQGDGEGRSGDRPRQGNRNNFQQN